MRIAPLTFAGVSQSTGRASFDQKAFNSLSGARIADGPKFVGSETTGLGGFSAALRQFSNLMSGFIKMEQDGVDRADRNIQSEITTVTDRIQVMQTALSHRLAAADSLAARLESQQKTLAAGLRGSTMTAGI